MQRDETIADFSVVGMGSVSTSTETGALWSTASRERAATEANSSIADSDRTFRFGRMFPELESRPFRPEDKGLIALGEAMQDGPDAGEHPSLPAGYTFLAQFITHDISLDLTGDIPEGPIALEEIEQGRSPLLDLDSVYGNG